MGTDLSYSWVHSYSALIGSQAVRMILGKKWQGFSRRENLGWVDKEQMHISCLFTAHPLCHFITYSLSSSCHVICALLVIVYHLTMHLSLPFSPEYHFVLFCCIYFLIFNNIEWQSGHMLCELRHMVSYALCICCTWLCIDCVHSHQIPKRKIVGIFSGTRENA
jgi:hypothetical protein